jgi:hypothetical protein
MMAPDLHKKAEPGNWLALRLRDNRGVVDGGLDME